MDQNFAFTVEGSDQKAVELKLDPSQKPNKGDVVSLKDGKRARVRDVVLNLETGKHDVKLESVPDVEANPAISAEGNDPHPERHAVKDVLFDPKFSPKVLDISTPSAPSTVDSASSPAGPAEKAAANAGAGAPSHPGTEAIRR